jgi:YesN/AraC family two-component response regulator
MLNLLLWLGLWWYSTFSRINILEALRQNPNKIKPNCYRENFSDTATKTSIYLLKEGYLFQYTKSTSIAHAFAGIYFPIENLDLALSAYDQITINIEAQNAKRIPVQISMHYQNNLPRYLTNHLDITPNTTEYTLNISDFKTPSEWFEVKNQSENELPKKYLSNIQTIALESCHLLPKGLSDRYTIKSIILHKNIHIETIALAIFDLLATLLLFHIYIKPFSTREKIIHIPIQQINLTTKSLLIDKITSFIAINYTNPDLSLSVLQKALGAHSQDISKEIKNNFQLTFPQYLHKLRIEEAKRLFSINHSTPIAEIAYSVGFNSPNNFNRVFKSMEGITPKEFIQSSKK